MSDKEITNENNGSDKLKNEELSSADKILNKIKQVSEVCTIYAATANPLQVIVCETAQGRGILGVVDGAKTRGDETQMDAAERKSLLRRIGYKL